MSDHDVTTLRLDLAVIEGMTAAQIADLSWHVEQTAYFLASKIRAAGPHQPWCQRHNRTDVCATLPYSYNRDLLDDEPFTAYLEQEVDGEPRIILECDDARSSFDEPGYSVTQVERLAKHLMGLVDAARGEQ